MINVPFWYYAFNTIISPFLTQRTRSKFVLARPAKVTETLLKYIPVEEIPVQYGGLKRENNFEFSAEDGMVSELTIKSGSNEVIEMPVEEVRSRIYCVLTKTFREFQEDTNNADVNLYNRLERHCFGILLCWVGR